MTNRSWGKHDYVQIFTARSQVQSNQTFADIYKPKGETQ